MAACDADPKCLWSTDYGYCIVDCTLLHDQATCEMVEECFWSGSDCEVGLVA
jgi:hypothetical protein